MSTLEQPRLAVASSSAPPRATSDSLRRAIAFGVTFAAINALAYTVCEMRNWPLFTFHPATDRVDLFWAASRPGEGPAMYWYGWSATSLLVGAIAGGVAAMLPPRLAERIPGWLAWVAPTVAIPVLIYALMPFWTRG